MKTKLSLLCLIALSVCLSSCKKSVDPVQPQNLKIHLTTADLNAQSVTDNFLLNAYSMLDGVYANQSAAPWETGTDNWIYGSVAGGEAHKGSTPNDQPDAASISLYTSATNNTYFEDKWQVNILGIYYSNSALNELTAKKDSLSAAYIAEATAEVHFLRGFFELEMAKLWRNVPYIAQSQVYNNGYHNLTNAAGPIWTQIEADFVYAKTHLPVAQAQVGKPNSYAAEAFLAKTYMFDHKYPQAQPLLRELIANGKTASGAKYALVHYANNFNPSTQNNAEGVFVVQAKVHDGSNGYDGNAGDVLNFPSGGPASCCGFFGPSFTFVNAFKTDPATGLPLFDTYNTSNLKSDMGISSTSPFVPTTSAIDSRLDWTVSRRGIPCLDWGNMPGDAWVRAQSSNGPYFNLKTLYYQSAQATTSESYGGWAPNQSTSNCYNAIRFADVLLWAAEVEVETGSLQKAEDYVNMVRTRAADPTGWVHTYINPATPLGGFTSHAAANYKVGLYGQAGGHQSTGFVISGQAYARKAVYFERTLELGLEGHRFFDLQRWDGLYGGPAGAGYMSGVLNAYIKHEAGVAGFQPIYKGAVFVAGKDELYPIPQAEIDAMSGKLKQNPGY